MERVGRVLRKLKVNVATVYHYSEFELKKLDCGKICAVHSSHPQPPHCGTFFLTLDCLYINNNF